MLEGFLPHDGIEKELPPLLLLRVGLAERVAHNLRHRVDLGVAVRERVDVALPQRLAESVCLILPVWVRERHADRHSQRLAERLAVIVHFAERLAHDLLNSDGDSVRERLD